MIKSIVNLKGRDVFLGYFYAKKVSIQKMKYEEFIAIMREKAQERLGKAYKVMAEKHMTNNGMLVDALYLNRTEEPPSPSLYLNTCFDLYQESMGLDDIMDEILEVYEWEEARMLSISDGERDD